MSDDASNHTVDNKKLEAFVQRIETLEEDKAEFARDIRDVYVEAKGQGLDVKAIRRVVKLRKLDKDELDAQAATLDLYCSALGMKSFLL